MIIYEKVKKFIQCDKCGKKLELKTAGKVVQDIIKTSTWHNVWVLNSTGSVFEDRCPDCFKKEKKNEKV